MNKKNLIKFFASTALAGFLCMLLLGVASPVAAVNCTTNNDCSATPATSICSNSVCVSGGQWFKDVLNNFLNIVVWPLFIFLSIAMFVWAGILYLTAHGDPSHISLAHKAVIWGIVGIVVAILGFSAVQTIERFITAPSQSPNGGAPGACTSNGACTQTLEENCTGVWEQGACP